MTQGSWAELDALADQDPPDESLNLRLLSTFDVGGTLHRQGVLCADSAPGPFFQYLFQTYRQPIAVDTSIWASRTHDKAVLPVGAGADFLFLNIQGLGNVLYFSEPGPTVETEAVSEAREDGQFLSVAVNFNGVGVSYSARYAWNGPGEGRWGILLAGNEPPIFELPLDPGGEGAAESVMPVTQWLEGGPSPAAVTNGIGSAQVEARAFVKEMTGLRLFRFGARLHLR